MGFQRVQLNIQRVIRLAVNRYHLSKVCDNQKTRIIKKRFTLSATSAYFILLLQPF